ncbi:MAG: hypothetical protein HOM74_02245, partial [Proteobacteria bacterium]|nr:hypothetical protein [Pseudomonadota bacterium]
MANQHMGVIARETKILYALHYDNKASALLACIAIKQFGLTANGLFAMVFLLGLLALAV